MKKNLAETGKIGGTQFRKQKDCWKLSKYIPRRNLKALETKM